MKEFQTINCRGGYGLVMLEDFFFPNYLALLKANNHFGFFKGPKHPLATLSSGDFEHFVWHLQLSDHYF